MKKIKPDTGHVTVVGEIGYLPQELEFASTVTIRSYLSNYIAGDREEYKIISVLDQLEMADIDLDRLISDLSGGQQRKIAFAKLLLQERTILLLDEPTNHIDAATQEWLVRFLNTWKDLVILISHDRALLNEVCTTIVEIADQQAHIYDGNYDAYKIEKEHRYQNALADHTVWLKRKRKMELRLADMRVRASAAPNPALGRLIRSRVKYLEREIISKPSVKPNKEQNLTTNLAGGTHRGKFILSVERAQ
jgi:ATPase subunit of ABC transporter with duplicated ATPase domains